MSEENQPQGTSGPGDARHPTGADDGPAPAAGHGTGTDADSARWPLWGPDEGAAERGDGTEPRRVLRSRQHKVVGGVCGGLGRYFDLDPVLFRVPLGVLSVVSGIGLIFYGLAWLLIPAEGDRENELRRLLSGRVEGASLAAVLVALVGCGLFLASMGTRSTSVSLVLAGVVTGAAYWSQHRRRSEAGEAAGVPADPATAHAVAEAPPEAQAPPVPSGPSWWRAPLTKGEPGQPAAGEPYLWGPDDAVLTDAERAARYAWPGRPLGDPGDGTTPPSGTGTAPGSGRPRKRRPAAGPALGGLVFLCALLAGAAGIALTWGDQPLRTSLLTGFACALAVFGTGLLVSAFVGRLGVGTVLAVVLTALLLAGSSLVPAGIGTEWKTRTWTPSSVADTRPAYRLDSGEAELDLRRLRLKEGQTVRTGAELGAGRLKVVVPRNATVELEARSDVGDVRVPVRTDEDGLVVFSSSGGLDRRMRTTLEPFGGADAKGTVRLELGVDVGQVEVVRQLPSGERSDGTGQRAPGGSGPPGPEEHAPDRPASHEEPAR
ncbi:PspC domain-containing protein [Streptomyces sp. HNM0574]|uniref:PspC domain-containing protein n=1 Tax=Streptomyces sp. HNM0574 TaxID=2714954 RepID=UPI001F0D9513|nr:PspC domain-containing protein [Streptomyces sp. HNM0574]